MPHDDTTTSGDTQALRDLTERVGKLELENLQLRMEALFVQIQLLALERGEPLGEDVDDVDAAVLWDQVRALGDRLERTG